MQGELTAERLREVLAYDSETGSFTWTGRSGQGKAQPGALAGSPISTGYVQIKVDYRKYYAHRLAWLFVHGQWPGVIDHLNGDRADNRISNLRDVSQQENTYNLHAVRNKHGFPGVSLHRPSGLFKAAIRVAKERRSLGYFPTPEEAYAAYVAAKAVRDGA